MWVDPGFKDPFFLWNLRYAPNCIRRNIILSWNFTISRYVKAAASTPCGHKKASVYDLLRHLCKSRFSVVFFLIVTFVGFVVIPDIIYLFTVISNNNVVQPPGPVTLVCRLHIFSRQHGQSRDKSEKKLFARQPAVHLLFNQLTPRPI